MHGRFSIIGWNVTGLSPKSTPMATRLYRLQ